MSTTTKLLNMVKFVTLLLPVSYTCYVEVTIVIQKFHGQLTFLSPCKLKREHALTQVLYGMIYMRHMIFKALVLIYIITQVTS